MAFSDFTLPEAVRTFRLMVREETSLFANVAEASVSTYLTEALADNIPLARAIHTEKARSELIITPILLELLKLCGRRIGFFSGTDFDVDPDQGLTGTCDYLISRSPEQYFITAPILIVVEAKRDSIKDGLGQCAATMVAAQLFNQRHETSVTAIHGVVTTGTNWQALKLEGQTLWIDRQEYYIEQPGKILGVLFRMVHEQAVPTPAPVSPG